MIARVPERRGSKFKVAVTNVKKKKNDSILNPPVFYSCEIDINLMDEYLWENFICVLILYQNQRSTIEPILRVAEIRSGIGVAWKFHRTADCATPGAAHLWFGNLIFQTFRESEGWMDGWMDGRSIGPGSPTGEKPLRVLQPLYYVFYPHTCIYALLKFVSGLRRSRGSQFSGTRKTTETNARLATARPNYLIQSASRMRGISEDVRKEKEKFLPFLVHFIYLFFNSIS